MRASGRAGGVCCGGERLLVRGEPGQEDAQVGSAYVGSGGAFHEETDATPCA